MHIAELAGPQAVTVEIGARPQLLPQRLLGWRLFFWLIKTGVNRTPTFCRMAHRIRAGGDMVIGSPIRTLRRHGVELGAAPQQLHRMHGP